MTPCVTGDLLVAVADGRAAVPFHALAAAAHDALIWCVTDDNAPKVAFLRNPRLMLNAAPVVRVVCDDGSRLRVTPDHRFVLTNGTRRRADELRPGDGLAVLTRRPPDPDRPGGGDPFGGRQATGECWGTQVLEAAAVAECVSGRRTLFDDLAGRPPAPKEEKLYAGGVDLCRKLGRRFTESEWFRWAPRRGLQVLPYRHLPARKAAFADDCAILAGVPDPALRCNHKVAAVEPAGHADVYGGEVEVYQTYCVGGWDAGLGGDGRPRLQFLVVESE